ncbi:MAG: polyprenyl synthetase family protein [Sphingobacteriia bacterium]|nr:polyprenyl synthetase family protein [Bacteroidota bacterium]NBW43630.1 polyprenyl synthetase family protein [Sphingobacteriia bacterium]
MRSKVPLLDWVTRYIVRRKGKQIRPMLVYLAARCYGECGEKSRRAAALVELLHTATLVHDDVVDGAPKRRGFWSINALWKNKIAVLIGDYLLSRGLLLALDHKDYQVLHLTSNAVRRMSEGELLQIEKARKLDITEEVYFEIISAKTASLMATCCAVGVASVLGESEEGVKRVEEARQFGETLGLVFQMRDDLLDFDGHRTGKAPLADIKEKKLTLPLIHALGQVSWLERRRWIGLIKGQPADPRNVSRIVEFIESSGGLAYARRVMQDLVEKGQRQLESFPAGSARDSLGALLVFAAERDH